MRALANGELKGMRDNRNAWQIDKQDLENWSADRPGPDLGTHRTADRDPVRAEPTDTPETLARLAVAEARLADTIAERDRLAKLLEEALKPRPGILDRLLGRG